MTKDVDGETDGVLAYLADQAARIAALPDALRESRYALLRRVFFEAAIEAGDTVPSARKIAAVAANAVRVAVGSIDAK